MLWQRSGDLNAYKLSKLVFKARVLIQGICVDWMSVGVTRCVVLLGVSVLGGEGQVAAEEL